VNHDEAHPMILQMHAMGLRNVAKGCPGKRVIASIGEWQLWNHYGLYRHVTDMLSSSFINRL
jgi:hypothetical protein